jgi:hypothetical protein
MPAHVEIQGGIFVESLLQLFDADLQRANSPRMGF